MEETDVSRFVKDFSEEGKKKPLKVNLVYQFKLLTFYYLIIDSFFTR